jgi:hypothetical protein
MTNSNTNHNSNSNSRLNDRFVDIHDSYFSLDPDRPVVSNRRVNFRTLGFLLPIEYQGRGFFDLSFFAPSGQNLTPNF